MSDLAIILISVYLCGAFIAFLMWTQLEIEGYSVIWWPITFVKFLGRTFWDAVRY